jgi:putative oxidoreductase
MRNQFDGWWALPLRLAVGGGFVAHGVAKLQRGPEVFAGILAALAVPAPHLMAWITIAVEVLGGVAVIAGLKIRATAVPLVAVLLVAAVTVHLPYGFSSVRLIAVSGGSARFGPVGYELDLIYIACLLALAAGGAGPLSIDRLLGNGGERSGINRE